MMTALSAMLAYLRAFLIARHRSALETVAHRQQLAVYKRRQPLPKLNRFDRLFWKGRSRRRRQGRPKVTEEIRALIRRMKRENPTWGAPRIHGELLALGFEISEPTVSRYLRRLKRIPEEIKASQWTCKPFFIYSEAAKSGIPLGFQRRVVVSVSSMFLPAFEFPSLSVTSRIGGLHHRYNWSKAA